MSNQLYLPQVNKQIQCTIPGHSNYIVNKICLDKDCKDSNLVCDRCDKVHKTHREKLFTIAEVQDSFIQFKNTDQAKVSDKSISKIIVDFENLSTKKLKELNTDLKQLLNQTNLMEISFLNNKISSSYTDLQNQVTQLLNYVELQEGEINFKILQPSDLYPKIHDKLTIYLHEINKFWKKNTGYGELQISIKQDQSLQQILQQNLQQQQINQQPQPKSSILNQETKKLANLQQETDNLKLLEPSNKNAQFSLQDQLGTFQFTPEFCSQHIKCITSNRVQKASDNIKMDLACLNKPISQYEKKSFVFKINRLNGSIGIGIAISLAVQAYYFMIKPLDNHGLFMVLNNGFIYNDSYPKYYKINKQIEFKEGQIYILTIDPRKGGKEFQIQQLSQNTKPYTMPIHIDSFLDYHVLVSMGKKDDEVELLNEI